jgi:thiol-disulfide isomerase/thioredoxin
MKRWGLIFTFALLSCGRHSVDPEPFKPPVVTGPQTRVVVAIFGATWCSACKSEIPNLDARLKRLPEFGQIDFRVYVTDAQTQVDCDKYTTRALHIDAKCYPDPQGKTFRSWVGGSVIPAVAVLTEDLKIIKAFRGGTGWDSTDIAASAVNALK